MKKPKAIFFDIDNTLFSTTSFVSQARRNGLKAMVELGLDMDPDELMILLQEIVDEFGSNDDSHYNKLLKRIPEEKVTGHNLAILEAAGVVGYGQTKFRYYKPHEDVTEVLRELSKTDLILGIISNGRTIKQAEKLVRLGILPFLNPQAIFISEQMGMAKPNPKFFLAACEKFNVPAQEVMIVGDHPELDIKPTKELGMIAIQNCRNIEPDKKYTQADYHINNFWDLLEIIRHDFDLS